MFVFIRISLINLLIISIFSLQPLLAEEQVTPINFFNLEDIDQSHKMKKGGIDNGQLITIRGFLYKSPESKVILAAEPDLKSCCVGSTSQRQRQLLVTGDIDHAMNASTAVTLQGNLIVAMRDEFPFKLENSVVVAQDTQCYVMLGLVGLGLILVAGAIFFALRKKQGR
ncbi:MAG TPA: hypothetical protein VGP47_06680 [Parachlamydiaceae bacterium]|nr:hypothetical protein [Parachlamydiaceae bacterium]